MKNLKQLKTFGDACKVEGLDATKVIPDFAFYPEQDRKAMIAHAKLVIIVRAANRLANKGKEWKPDWDNGKWDKYYAWFWMDGGSSGFRFDDCASWDSDSDVGSRLCFISKAACEHVANQFIDLYRDYFVM
jgi:hypothetical protein